MAPECSPLVTAWVAAYSISTSKHPYLLNHLRKNLSALMRAVIRVDASGSLHWCRERDLPAMLCSGCPHGRINQRYHRLLVRIEGRVMLGAETTSSPAARRSDRVALRPQGAGEKLPYIPLIPLPRFQSTGAACREGRPDWRRKHVRRATLLFTSPRKELPKWVEST